MGAAGRLGSWAGRQGRTAQEDSGTDGQEYSGTGPEERAERRAADMLSTRQKAEVRNFTVCWQPAMTSASSLLHLLLLLRVWPRPGAVMQSVMPSVMPHSIHYGGKCKRHKQHRTTSACPLSVHTHIRRRVRVQVHDSATRESTGYTSRERE